MEDKEEVRTVSSRGQAALVSCRPAPAVTYRSGPLVCHSRECGNPGGGGPGFRLSGRNDTRIRKAIATARAYAGHSWTLLLGRLVFAILVAAVLGLPVIPPRVEAGSQTWYLSDFTGATGADYAMYRGAGDGTSDALAIASGVSRIWSSDETSNIVINMSGSWSVTLWAQSSPPSSSLTMDIGVLSGGTFTSKGASATQTVSKNGGTISFSVTTTSHTLNPGDYLAVRVNITGNKDVTVDVNDVSGNSPSYVTSPAAVPNYPGTVLISFTVTDNGATAGLNFGALNAGTTDNPEAQQGASGAVTLTVAAETNVNTNIQARGDAFYITRINGAATGGSTTTLVDSGANFTTAGVVTGDIIVNRTDGSTGAVTEVTSSTTLTVSSFSGGIDNSFASGDLYSVRPASPAYSIAIGNATWNTTNSTASDTAMSGSYATITTSTAGVQKVQDVWHWLSVPSGQYAGTYTSIFYYQAVQQ